jgi:hypothetical protein
MKVGDVQFVAMADFKLADCVKKLGNRGKCEGEEGA